MEMLSNASLRICNVCNDDSSLAMQSKVKRELTYNFHESTKTAWSSKWEFVRKYLGGDFDQFWRQLALLLLGHAQWQERLRLDFNAMQQCTIISDRTPIKLHHNVCDTPKTEAREREMGGGTEIFHFNAPKLMVNGD